MKLILLPGMDGTGDLFAQFVLALPATIDTQIVRYPTHTSLSYDDMLDLVRDVIPHAEPFVLLAESFSTPLAIRIAAANQPNLKGLILCAGFVMSPLHGWRRSVCLTIAPVLFRIPPPSFAIKRLLVGSGAPDAIVIAVRRAISSVKPATLAARLKTILNCDESLNLRQIKVPALYLQARQDALVNASTAEQILRLKSDISVVSLNGPHLILQREPEKTAAIVAEFIGRLS